jgi:hypothetical protein
VKGEIFISQLVMGQAFVMDQVIDPMQEFIFFQKISQGRKNRDL